MNVCWIITLQWGQQQQQQANDATANDATTGRQSSTAEFRPFFSLIRVGSK